MGNFELLKWDSGFFGFNIAKINDTCLSPGIFGNLYQELKNNKVKLIYWPSDLNCRTQNEISKEFNGNLVDVKTQFEKDLRKTDRIIFEKQTSIEFYKNKKPADRMLEIAIQCGEFSRFKVDPDFPSGKFEELYKTWLIKSLTGELADEVIITKKNELVTGLITVGSKDGKGNIGLVGVHGDSRGIGQGSILIKAALNYFVENKCYVASVVTQGLNQAACRLYEKFGFRVSEKVNFYHFWIK